MGVWNQFARILVGAVDGAVEFHRKKALNQRLKEIVKKENAEVNRAYLALGKRYYESLRGKTGDEAADRMCVKVDCAQERMRKARKCLVDLRSRCSVAIIGGADGPTTDYIARKAPCPDPIADMELDEQPQDAENTTGDQLPQCEQQKPAQADQPQNREAAEENEEWIPPLPDSVEE